MPPPALMSRGRRKRRPREPVERDQTVRVEGCSPVPNAVAASISIAMAPGGGFAPMRAVDEEMTDASAERRARQPVALDDLVFGEREDRPPPRLRRGQAARLSSAVSSGDGAGRDQPFGRLAFACPESQTPVSSSKSRRRLTPRPHFSTCVAMWNRVGTCPINAPPRRKPGPTLQPHETRVSVRFSPDGEGGHQARSTKASITFVAGVLEIDFELVVLDDADDPVAEFLMETWSPTENPPILRISWPRGGGASPR